MPELTEGISSNAGKRNARSMKPLLKAGRKKFVMIVGFEAGVLGLRWLKVVECVFSKKRGKNTTFFWITQIFTEKMRIFLL